MKRQGLLLVLVAVLSVASIAAADDVDSVRDKTIDRVQAVRSVCYTSLWTVDSVYDGEQHHSVTTNSFAFLRPGCFFKEGSFTTVFCDGTNVTFRQSWRHRYFQQTFTSAASVVQSVAQEQPMLAMTAHERALLGDDPAGALKKDFDESGPFTVRDDEKLDGRSCWVLQHHVTNETYWGWTWTYWIDQESGLLLRRLFKPGKDSVERTNENRILGMEYAVRDFALNSDISPKTFVFVPEEGDRKIASLEALSGFATSRRFQLSGKAAPDFTLKLLGGGTFNLSSQSGKVVIVDFWATWCGPCMSALPSMKKLAESYKDKDVVFVGVSRDDSDNEEKVKAAVASNGLPYAVGIDVDGIGSQYKVGGIPCVVLIGRDGTVQGRKIGYSSDGEDALAKDIDSLLAGQTLETGKIMTEAELKEAEEEDERSVPVTTTVVDSNSFRLVWSVDLRFVHEASWFARGLQVRLPAALLAAQTKTNLLALSLADGSVVASAPVPESLRSAKRQQTPSFYYLRNSTNGAFVVMKAQVKKKTKDNESTLEFEFNGIGAQGELTWARKLDPRESIASVQVVPLGPAEDGLLISTWQTILLIDGAGREIFTLKPAYGDTVSFADRIGDGVIEMYVVGTKAACYELVVPPPEARKPVPDEKKPGT